jgi:hypothetical protein
VSVNLSGTIIRGTRITPLKRALKNSAQVHPPRMRNQISASLEVASGAFSKELRPDRAPPARAFRNLRLTRARSRSRSHARTDLHLARTSHTLGLPSPPRPRLPRPRTAMSASPEPVSDDEDKACSKANGDNRIQCTYLPCTALQVHSGNKIVVLSKTT